DFDDRDEYSVRALRELGLGFEVDDHVLRFLDDDRVLDRLERLLRGVPGVLAEAGDRIRRRLETVGDARREVFELVAREDAPERFACAADELERLLGAAAV